MYTIFFCLTFLDDACRRKFITALIYVNNSVYTEDWVHS